MKRVNSILTIILLIIAGCGGSRQSTDDLVIVDVTRSYPQKELILQDFMDVEYIALETGGEFYTQGVVLDVGNEIIVVRNNVSDGDIFIFDRNGKGLRKINRRGQGPEEYISITGLTLDEDNGEMFVRDAKGIIVYDLYGNFLRRFPLSNNVFYSSFKNYDREHLICGKTPFQVDEKTTESQPCSIISKKDGSIVKDIQIHFKQAVNTRAVADGEEQMVVFLPSMLKSIIPYHDSWVITELSSDTVFRLLPDFSIIPFMARTPSIHSMNPEVFLLPVIHTDRYYFIETLRKQIERIPGFFQRKKLIYDRLEKTIYLYTVCNDDYTTPKTFEFSLGLSSNMNNKIAYLQKLEAIDLVEAYEKGQLKGKLKEIAAGLKEEDNPVIMLVKHKK